MVTCCDRIVQGCPWGQILSFRDDFPTDKSVAELHVAKDVWMVKDWYNTLGTLLKASRGR